jgi:hypothetical protein
MLVSLKDALKTKMKSLKVHQQLKEIQVIALWADTVGSRLSGQTKATRMVRGRLYVMVSSSAWAHQLSFFRREYIQKINTKLGEPVIKDIFFQVGNIDSKAEEETIETDKGIAQRDIELSESEKEEIQNAAAEIDNDELQKVFRDFMEKDYKMRKARLEDGWRKCVICGTVCPPDEDFCWFCHQDRPTGRKERLLSWFRETPWMNFNQAEQLISDLSREEFSRAKGEAMGLLYKSLLNYEADTNCELSAIEKNELKQTALAYAMLATEQTPDRLDYAVLLEVLGDVLYKRAFGS